MDWYVVTLVGGVDPVGPASGITSARLQRGGNWGAKASESYAGNRTSGGAGRVAGKRYNGNGLRIVRTLP
ncbi:MAG: hypothetical protein WC340_05670 [Kiritimatiellia bacterium]